MLEADSEPVEVHLRPPAGQSTISPSTELGADPEHVEGSAIDNQQFIGKDVL
jgi:hypothetical protein